MDDLEAAVRVAWDRDAIAIYADHLMSIGDPRGELVAIDLRIDEGGADADVTARREQLIAEWFGADLPPGIVRYGFVDVRASGMNPDSQLAIALRGPGASYIRSVELAGPQDELAPALEMLLAEPRPWLTKLVVHQWQDTEAPTLDLAAALPALDTLELSGRNVLAGAPHPNVQRMRITGFDAHRALLEKARWPKLTQLDFAFHCQYVAKPRFPGKRELQRLLRGVPELRELDLSRCGLGKVEPYSLGADVILGEFLVRFARSAIEVLHLPKLELDPKLQHALAAIPLRELVAFEASQMPTHPTAKVSLRTRKDSSSRFV